MKLIKINEDHYVVKNNDGVITHSTQPLEIIYTPGLTMTNPPIGFINIMELSLEEVKELLGEVDVEKKAREEILYNEQKREWWKQGYTQALEDNNEKKYTEAQLIWAIQEAYGHGQNDEFDGLNKVEKSIIVITNYLRSKTEWEVEIINGKLTIL
jgi:hypothetical protein